MYPPSLYLLVPQYRGFIKNSSVNTCATESELQPRKYNNTGTWQLYMQCGC